MFENTVLFDILPLNIKIYSKIFNNITIFLENKVFNKNKYISKIYYLHSIKKLVFLMFYYNKLFLLYN